MLNYVALTEEHMHLLTPIVQLDLQNVAHLLFAIHLLDRFRRIFFLLKVDIRDGICCCAAKKWSAYVDVRALDSH